MFGDFDTPIKRYLESLRKWRETVPHEIGEARTHGFCLVDVVKLNQFTTENIQIPTPQRRWGCQRHEYVTVMLITYGTTVDNELVFVMVKAEVLIRNKMGSWYHGEIVSGLEPGMAIANGRRIDFEPKHILAVHDAEQPGSGN